MSHADYQYQQVLNELLNNTDRVEGRNGGVSTLFGKQLTFDDVGNFFPLLTTKKVHFKSIVIELLWFIKGLSNTEYLHKHGVTIWDEWADENGELGPVYGKQWRSWYAAKEGFNFIDPYIDQLKNVIQGIKDQPYGRRHIVSAWNPAEIDDMALPPCHALFQFHVRGSGELDLQLYQRSADWFLGVPFNIASYALLVILVARETGLKPGKFVHTFGNYHLYDNHREQAIEQVSRSWNAHYAPFITIDAEPSVSIFDLEPENILLNGYTSYPSIKAPVSK